MQIHWPNRFHPDVAPIHVKNEIHCGSQPDEVWHYLIHAREWPLWYPNAKRVVTGQDTLRLGAIFYWTTFGARIKSIVEEYTPNERIAWSAKGLGIDVYHAWCIQEEENGCKITTEETQYGWACQLSKSIWPNRMYKHHQIWLENLCRKTRDMK